MTPSRAEAARINGAKSRGPKTEQGRRAISLNAVKHGLTAETVVLPSESEEEYEAELREYLRHFAPANKPEDDLVRQLASVHWRLARYTHIEASLLSVEMERQRDRVANDWSRLEECGRVALAFEALSGPHSSLALLNRYEARLHNEYQRLLKSLIQSQAARPACETKLQNEPKLPAAEPIRAEQKASQPENPQPETRNLLISLRSGSRGEPFVPDYGLDWSNDEDEGRRAGERDRGHDREGPVEFPRPIEDESCNRRSHDTCEIADEILQTGPAAGGFGSGQRLRDRPDIGRSDTEKNHTEYECRHGTADAGQSNESSCQRQSASNHRFAN